MRKTPTRKQIPKDARGYYLNYIDHTLPRNSFSENIEKFRGKNQDSSILVVNGRHADSFSGGFNLEISQNVFEVTLFLSAVR